MDQIPCANQAYRRMNWMSPNSKTQVAGLGFREQQWFCKIWKKSQESWKSAKNGRGRGPAWKSCILNVVRWPSGTQSFFFGECSMGKTQLWIVVSHLMSLRAQSYLTSQHWCSCSTGLKKGNKCFLNLQGPSWLQYHHRMHCKPIDTAASVQESQIGLGPVCSQHSQV